MKSGDLLVGKYKIEKKIAEGGFGAVYLAFQLSLNRRVVIKTLKEAKKQNSSAFKRFQKEAIQISKINHPNIVKYYDMEKDSQNNYYLIMEYVEGVSLDKLIKNKQKLKTEQILSIMRDVCNGLQVVHEAGIIHRDIKPANIIVGDKKSVLIDFGLLKDLQGKDHITKTGITVGTPLYMAPEQIYNKNIGPWSDIYSLGVIVYELITGTNPFYARNNNSVFENQLNFKPENLFHSELEQPVSRAFALVINKALSKKTSLRYSNALDFLKDLEQTAFYDDSETSVTMELIQENEKNNFLFYTGIVAIIVLGVTIGLIVGKYLF